jgi:Xaa-Pro dipeptidase
MLLNLDRAADVLSAEKFDGLISATAQNNLYLSGVQSIGQQVFPNDSQFYCVATSDNLASGTLVISAGESELALTGYSSVSDVITFGTFFREVAEHPALTSDEQRIAEFDQADTKATALDALVEAIDHQGLASGSIGVDEKGPFRGLIQALAERLPHATLTPCSETFQRIRMVKTQAELDRLIQALRITEAGIRAVTDAAAVGVTEQQLNLLFRKTVVELEGVSRFTLIKFGRGMAVGHEPPTDAPLAAGDYIWLDVGCSFGGYQSDIGRILAFGEPTRKLSDLLRASKAGQERAIECMVPGTVASHVFSEAVDRVRAEGIPHYRRHHVGHGIGLETYEPPILSPNTEIPLEAGMVFEVETPYYELGFGGAFIEDTVVVTDSGAKVLTELPRELQVIPA